LGFDFCSDVWFVEGYLIGFAEDCVGVEEVFYVSFGEGLVVWFDFFIGWVWLS